MRQGHMPELAQPAGAIDRGSLVQVARHVLEGRQEDDEGEAEIPPDRGDRHPDQRPVARGQPGDRRDAEQAQILVDQAELGVEQPDPDQADHRRRDDVGREEQGAGEGGQRPALVDEERRTAGRGR